MTLGPRKCETPGCLAPLCPMDWHPEAVDVAHKLRAAWLWECECGWLCRVPAVAAVQLQLEQPKVRGHLDDVVDRVLVARGDRVIQVLGIGPRPVLLDASKTSVAVGLEIQFP